MSAVLMECPVCRTDKHLREHCEIECDWVVCKKCKTTLDVNTGRYNTPRGS